MNITAADVNKLRQMSGAGMMDCKKALQETEGDFDKAIDYLRKKGQKVAGKRADRDANQGFVIAKTSDDQSYGAVIMVNCETDFVGKTEEFIKFTKDLLDLGLAQRIHAVADLMPMSLGTTTVEEKLNELLGKTGEKIQIAHFEVIEAPVVFAYNHFGNRLATVIGLSKKEAKNVLEIGHELAMQVAAMDPLFVRLADVPADISPELLDGKSKEEICLLSQKYFKDHGFIQTKALEQDPNNLTFLGKILKQIYLAII